MSEEKKKGGGLVKILIAVAVIAVVFFLANHFGLTGMLTDVPAMQAWFQGLGMVGYLVFILIYILVAVFMLPAFAITLVAGVTFGPIIGAILALLGATAGAMVAFLVARFIARDSIVNKFGDSPIFKKIEKGFAENGTSFLILTRLVPVFPYNLQNYVYGITAISFATFSLVSLVTMAPGAFIYAFMAGQIVTEGPSVMLMVQFAAAGALLFLVSLIPKYIAKKKGINLNDK